MDSLTHHDCQHGLQGNLCCGAWSTSSLSFFTDLDVCKVVSHTLTPLSGCIALQKVFFFLLKYVVTKVLPLLLMGLVVASGRSISKPDGIGSIRHNGSF